MYEELLQKIKGYLNDLIAFDKTQNTKNRHDIGFLEGTVHVSKEVLSLIEAYKPEELDKPNTEGYHWMKKDNDIIGCVYMFHEKVEDIWYCRVNGNIELVTDWDIKWIKADKPKIGS